MNKTLLTFTMLALLAGTPALLCADGTNSPVISIKIAVKPKPYPLKYCLVSGDKIGEMGKPVITNYMGQEIKFCCSDCVKDFRKDPKKYIKKLAEAEKEDAAKKDAK